MLSWATPKPLEIPRKMAADRVVYLVSDIHLGDGSPSDTFMGKDREFIEFLRRARAHGAHLVVAGDIIDFHQAFAMSRVLKAHGKVIGELSRYAADLGVTYIWGNHDHDISLFRDLLAFDVCSRLEIGDGILVQHGYEYDPWIGPHLEASHLATQFHHLVERLLRTWIRLPLQHFYNKSNRLFFWLTHKTALLLRARIRLQKALGMHESAAQAEAILTYWARNQLGDAAGMFRFMRDFLVESPYRVLVTGHSHLPGRVQVAPGKTYVNTGSWTFNSSSYAVWDGQDFVVRDWLTGQTHDDRAYRQLVSGAFDHIDFLDWWRGEYLGWFRFRVGEQPWRPRLTAGSDGDDNRPAPLG
ncbi:MAG: metallophosphoesterase family protein [Alphaproteobacteria bacterium]|nr:metallophosphoesterase family protein [Alphaproteobacteria bacterium]